MARRGSFAVIGGLLLLTGAGFGVWSLMGGSTSTSGSPSSSSFGFEAWLVRCQTVKDNVGCGMSQQILDQRSRQPVLQLHLGRAVSGEGHQLVAVLPLGVAVPPGIVIQIGETKRNVAFTQCLPGGCVAPLPVDAALLGLLKSGKDGRIGVVDRGGKTVVVPFSLKGFAPAFDKMEASGGNGASGATWWSGSANSSETK
ncbi:MAG: invasion associated locus B family protein [Alphaproteobacteria bacterium]|nr:invasion associated locus B family protein [Alphaproteobacteria bacterium]